MSTRTPSRAARSALAVLLAAAVTVALGTSAASPSEVTPGDPTPQQTVVDDFSGGVTAVNHPDGAGQYGVWFDATHDAFGTPSATTAGGRPAMRIDDGGFTNGVYAIVEAVVPADGTYVVEADLHVVEAGSTDAVGSYQVGVAAGDAAVHRGPNPSAVGRLDATGAYQGLTTGDDTAAGPQAVTTSAFDARAGDDLLVAFGTDVRTGSWNDRSGLWSGSHVVVGQIRLVPVAAAPIVVDNDDGPAAYGETGSWITSGATGYDGGTYRFAPTGAEATATWTAQLPEAGSYDVEVVYVAGTNRATSAVYEVQTVDGPVPVPVDQTTQSLTWVRLGTFELPAGPVAVTLDAAASEPASTVVIADAVRLVPDPGPPPLDDPEMRLAAVTVFDDIDDVGAIQATVDRLRDLQYNAVAVHTRYRGDATYVPNRANADFPNSEPRNPAAGDVDVLQEFTERGHAAGLTVFAYVNTHLVTSGATPEDRAEHVVNQHPEWITYEYNGGDPLRQEPGGEGLWLDPALPEVTRYLAGIAGDIMSNYDCDGIILDRIRYPQASFPRETLDFGYHPEAVERFNHRYRAEGVPDPDDPDWIAFRQHAITMSVTAIHRTVTDIDPDHLLLAYPIGRFTDATQFSYQDWPDWLHRNVVDAALPQVYNQDSDAFAASLAENRDAYGGDRLLGVTLDAFRPGNDLAGRIDAARVVGYDGSSPFRDGTMTRLGYDEDLARAWDGVAAWPEYPGQGEPIRRLDVRADPGAPGGARGWRVSNPNAETLHVTWWAPLTGETGSRYVPPGESTWQTAASRVGLVAVRWYDDRGRPRLDVAWSLR